MMNYTQTISTAHILLVVCLTMISACTIVPVQKRDDISKRFPERFVDAGLSTSDSNLYWKQSFPSSALHADIQTLLKRNYELKAARARIKQAAATFRVAKSGLMPSLEAEAEVERSRVKEASSSGSRTETNITFETVLEWEPDIWGRLKARKEAGFLLFEEKKVLADYIELNLQTLLVETWITYHGASMFEQALKEQQETNSELLGLIELRLAQGDGSVLDVLQQRGSLAGINRLFPGKISEKKRASNAYAVLMGNFPDNEHRPGGKWPGIDPVSSISNPYRLMVDRPDLRAALLALRAADNEVAAAIADRLPRISLGLTYTASGGSFSDVADNTALSFVSGILAPVFNAGRLKAKASLKKAQVLEYVSALEQAMLVAVREVSDALVREKELFEELVLLKKEISIAEETVEKAKVLYVNGYESFLSILVSLTKLQMLQQDEITLKQELFINRAHLLKALGAKWSKDDEKCKKE